MALSGLDYYGESRPAAETGCDFFDFQERDRQSLACAIGRATGSGIGASFTMASIQAFLRGLTIHQRGGIASIVSDLNRIVYEISPGNFYASLFHAWIDAARGQLHYVNAGHGPVLLLRQSYPRVRRLENTGTVLGLSLRVVYRELTVDLEPGDLLLAVTDGVNEALSEEEILRILNDHAQARPADLVHELLDAAAGVEDCTALAVLFKGRAAAKAESEAVELAFTAA